MIPEWLVPWWNWWAAITHLVHWGAIGAIGSLGAFLGAIFLADTANRDRRRRDAAILYGVAHAAGAASQILADPQVLKFANGKPVPPKVVASALLQSGGIGSQIAALEVINITNFPSVRLIDGLVQIKAILSIIKSNIELAAAGDHFYEISLLDEMKISSTKLELLADAMQDEGHRILKVGIR